MRLVIIVAALRRIDVSWSPLPSESRTFRRGSSDGRGLSRTLLVGCGATAREIIDLIERHGWDCFDVRCLPAWLHNRPERIPEAVRSVIREARSRGVYRSVFCLYGDCGSGGLLDRVLREEGVERIEGAHCYSFFSGTEAFSERSDSDAASFFLTDYLARHFDALVWRGLGLDRHPELLDAYFGNYERVVYLAQTEDEELSRRAESAAGRLGLSYERRFTGYGDLERVMERVSEGRREREAASAS